MLEIRFSTKRVADPTAVAADFLIVPVDEGETDAPTLRRLDRILEQRRLPDSLFPGQDQRPALTVRRRGAGRACRTPFAGPEASHPA